MLDRLKNLLRPPEVKASRTARLIHLESGTRARWTPRDYAALAREGYVSNAIVHRAVKLVAESRLLSAPPGSPAEGDCYIPAAGASGAWSGFDFQLMAYAGGGWVRIVPKSGMKAWVKSERLTVTYEDGTWRDGAALTANGGRVTLRAKEEELTLSGAFTETADAAFIPNRAIVLAVASRTTLAVTGATSYGVGIAGEAGKFGDLLGIALGSSNVGAIGPAAFYADTKVRVTANGSNFTGGKVRLVCYFLEMSAPAG